MEREKQEVLQKVRNYFLGKGDGDLPDPDLVDEFYESDPEFRKAFSEDEAIQKGTQWFDSRQDNLRLFQQLRKFCLGEDVKAPERWFIKVFYHSDPDFREACDHDPVVREVLDRWFKEENGKVSE